MRITNSLKDTKNFPGVGYYLLCTNIGEDICGTEYDAARVKWGGRWRLPTFEVGELVRLCWNKWEEVDGIWGRRFHYSANENTLFLPAARIRCYISGITYRNQIGKDIVGPERFIEQKEILMIL